MQATVNSLRCGFEPQVHLRSCRESWPGARASMEPQDLRVKEFKVFPQTYLSIYSTRDKEKPQGIVPATVLCAQREINADASSLQQPIPLPATSIGLIKDHLLGIKHGPFDTGPPVVPTAVRHLHLGNATETDANTAGHRRFQRYVTRHAMLSGQASHGGHHWLGPTTDHMQALRSVRSEHVRQEIGHQAMMPTGSVIGTDPHIHSRPAKVFHPCQ